MQATGMIVGGQRVHTEVSVYNWHDHGFEFKPGEGGRAVDPKNKVDLAVWHWTGGEGDLAALYNVLHTRELGVEFYICGGLVYQLCDPLHVDAYAAGSYNKRSVNIEVQNYGFRSETRQVPHMHRGIRPTFECVQNHKKRTFATFYPDDLAAVAGLAKAISSAIPSIPLSVPTHDNLAVYSNYISPRDMAGVHGHVGHYHLSQEKSDPGPQLLQHLIHSGVCKPERFFPVRG